MTVRKNFILDEETANHLELIAKRKNITQTQVVKDMIEKQYKEISIEEKLEAFNSIVKMPSGSLEGKTIQSIKTEMASEI